MQAVLERTVGRGGLMAPRTGQLDEISQALGELKGLVTSLDRYTHEREHNIANLAQKVDAISLQFGKDIASAKADIAASVTTAVERVEARIATIDERVTLLERTKERESGAKGVLVWMLQSPLVGWLAAAVLLVASWWRDHGGK